MTFSLWHSCILFVQKITAKPIGWITIQIWWIRKMQNIPTICCCSFHKSVTQSSEYHHPNQSVGNEERWANAKHLITAAETHCIITPDKVHIMWWHWLRSSNGIFSVARTCRADFGACLSHRQTNHSIIVLQDKQLAIFTRSKVFQ